MSLRLLLILLCATISVSGQEKTNTSKRPKKAKNIIFLIGDGMGTAQIYAGITAKGPLNIENFKNIGYSKTNSASHYITESAAGATAFATGEKTYNGAIGVDVNRKPLPTILEIAEEHGLATGLVVSSTITGATPAAFIAHQPSRNMAEEIAADFLRTDIDVFIGAGKAEFVERKDGRNLETELRQKGYQVLNDMSEISKVESGKLAGLLKGAKMSEGRGDQLLKSTQTALKILKRNKKGFFLMIEGAQIDAGGHDNNSQYIIEEMLDFDTVIGEALNFAAKDGNTLVVVTADHETGGYTLVGGDLKSGRVDGKFSTPGHTSVMVPVFAYGPGSEEFIGIYHNNTIFHKFMEAFRFTKK